jgi:ribosomal protein S14
MILEPAETAFAREQLCKQTHVARQWHDKRVSTTAMTVTQQRGEMWKRCSPCGPPRGYITELKQFRLLRVSPPHALLP